MGDGWLETVLMDDYIQKDQGHNDVLHTKTTKQIIDKTVSQCWDVLKFAPGKNVDFR